MPWRPRQPARQTPAVELAASSGVSPSGSLTRLAIAAIFTVFAITYVAEILGEDEELAARTLDRHVHRRRPLAVLWCWWDGVTAFTEYGIERLNQIIADERAAGRAPAKIQPTK
jgi:hypothetical protein